MEDSLQLRNLLLGLETLLLDPVRRADPDSIADLFAEDFREFGKSGRTYNKAEILEALRCENQPERALGIEDFKVIPFGSSAALVTYVAVVRQPESPETRSLRSSIWVGAGSKWQILFHQGTTTLDPPQPNSAAR